MSEEDQVVTPQQAEGFHFVICRRIAPPFEWAGPNSDPDICADCGHPIWVSRNSPRKPKRICDFCLLDLIDAAEKKGDDVVLTASNKGWLKESRRRIERMRIAKGRSR